MMYYSSMFHFLYSLCAIDGDVSSEAVTMVVAHVAMTSLQEC